LAMPLLRRGDWKHATLLFCALGGVKTKAWEKESRTMKNVIMVSINDIYEANQATHGNCQLSEMARGDWRIGANSPAFGCDYLVANYRGTLKGAWKIDKGVGNLGWVPVAQANHKNIPAQLHAARAADPKHHLRKACFVKPLSKDEEQRILRKLAGSRLYGPIGYFAV